MHMKIIQLALVGLALTLTGCAVKQGLYDWGGYDGLLYQSYKDPTTVTGNIQKLEAHIQKLEAGNQKVPPGLYADLGTMLLQAGEKTKAQASFRKERELWPESATLMDALINNGVMPKSKGATS
jgi:hypothetical protein